MRIARTLAAVLVSSALVLSVAAPAVAEPEAAPVVSTVDSGAATYAREFVFFLVCFLKGQFVGSTFPLC
ncbi:hypothetical protein ABZ942_32675 [Nocardia sp. NPDC046473]|uniref:hypothetical protein n=1 Tax=Nocardia sp. NPDC046473 TaxID=3155733 RepID=UPI003405A960